MLMEKLEIVLKEEDFGKQYAGKYVFVGISWGASNRITGECTKVNPLTKTSIVDIKQLQARMLIATLVEKPRIITLAHLLDESVNGLPPALGEILMSATDKVNGYSMKERDELKKLKERWDLE